MSEHSYIEISSDEAKRLALDTIQRIEKGRKDRIERFIAHEMERLNNGFFHKLFNRKSYTREDVIRLDAKSDFSEIDDFGFDFERQYNVCWDVVNAAKSGGKMFLSLDDYRRIS